MSTRRFGGSARFCAAIAAFSGASLLAMTAAQAGGFAIREQSAYYQGMSFAGSAAGDTLSSMFWNSAAAASVDGFNTETHGSVVFPHTEIEASSGAFVDAGLGTKSGDIGDPTFIPASYANYQITDQLYLGLATNSQYGFTTKPDNELWAGSPFAITSEVFSVNINPTVAYKVTPEFTVGVGVMVQYFDVRLRSGAANQSILGRTTEGDDWGVGFTAGATWKPVEGTTIGVGFRSAIDVDLEGTCTGTGLTTFVTPGKTCGTGITPVNASLTLPEMVTASIRQQIDPQWAVLGTVEWTNWSRLGGTVLIYNDAGVPVDSLPLGYDDGWFFSGGLEYEYSPYTTLRTGLGFEKSPISDEARKVFLPDNDRIWLSAGATFQLSPQSAIDIGYSHLFVEDAPICETEPTCASLKAEATGDIDIVSASFKYHWGGAEPELEPLK